MPSALRRLELFGDVVEFVLDHAAVAAEFLQYLLGFQRLDVGIAMTLAGLANMAMLIIAASLFHEGGATGIDSLEEATTRNPPSVVANSAIAAWCTPMSR